MCAPWKKNAGKKRRARYKRCLISSHLNKKQAPTPLIPTQCGTPGVAGQGPRGDPIVRVASHLGVSIFFFSPFPFAGPSPSRLLRGRGSVKRVKREGECTVLRRVFRSTVQCHGPAPFAPPTCRSLLPALHPVPRSIPPVPPGSGSRFSVPRPAYPPAPSGNQNASSPPTERFHASSRRRVCCAHVM